MKMTDLKKVMQQTPAFKWAPLGVAALLTIFAYQNCSKNAFVRSKSSEEGPQTPTGSGPDATLQINKGALYTNDEKVKLEMTTINATKMYLANDTCPTSSPDSQYLEAIVAQKDWILTGTEGAKSVNLLVFNDKMQQSKCITAHITLDQTGPQIKFIKVPADPTSSSNALFEIEAKDALSGVDGIFCKLDSAVKFTACDAVHNITNLTEGTHSLQAYAVDKSGNTSPTIEHTWFVDLTPPKVYIVAPKPPAVSNGSLVAIHFVGEDPGGSGLDHFECFLNNTSTGECTSPVILKNLSEKNYEFKVIAYDKVDLASNPAKVNFTVDNSSSGDFNILGVTGGKDKKVDAYLTDLTVPILTWSKSTGATGYKAYIYDKVGKKLICGPADFTGPAMTGPLNSSCKLADNTIYTARMIAIKGETSRLSPDFQFMVDATPPLIVVKSLVTNDEAKKADIKFQITDDGSGVQTAICYRKRGSSLVSNDCLNKTEISYVGLVEDEYIFSITATDEAGNVGQSGPKPFTIHEIVCDPFKQSTEGKCIKGIKANLFYASAADRALGNAALGKKYDTVAKLITNGIKSKSLIYFPFLDVRRREFSEGFVTNANKKVLDDEGKVLYEWFAMRMSTVLKLGPTDPTGYYQFMLISDDGANLFVDTDGNDKFEKIVDNDGTHSLRVGCNEVGGEVLMSANSRLKTAIHYYQGPRFRIGVSLFWRKVAKSGAALSPNCGFQSISKEAWEGAGGTYEKILKQGFKPLNVENFISD